MIIIIIIVIVMRLTTAVRSVAICPPSCPNAHARVAAAHLPSFVWLYVALQPGVWPLLTPLLHFTGIVSQCSHVCAYPPAPFNRLCVSNRMDMWHLLHPCLTHLLYHPPPPAQCPKKAACAAVTHTLQFEL